MFILKNAGIECAARGLKQGKIAFRSILDFKKKNVYLYMDSFGIIVENESSNFQYRFTQEDVFATDWIVADKELINNKEKLDE
jgi:hypothetical protein